MEEEKKYIYNDKAERIKKMNRFYIGATIFLGILFLLYLWLRMANQNLVNATVYGNTVLIIGASVLNTIIYHKDHATAKLKVIATLEMGLEYLLVGVQTDAHFITYVLIVLVALQIPYYDKGGLKRTCVGVSIHSLRDRYDCSGNKGYYCIERGYNMFCGRRAWRFIYGFKNWKDHIIV